MKTNNAHIYYVTTASGKSHITTELFVHGMVGPVPRTMCHSLIKRCTYPQPLQKTVKEKLDICQYCEACMPFLERLYEIEETRGTT